MGHSFVFLTLLVTTTAGSSMQPPTARDQEFRPRVGVVSEEVARQKIARYGITSVRSFALVNGTYQIEAERDGRPVNLEMDNTRGILKERGQVLALTPARDGLPFVPRPDPAQVKRLDDLFRYEQRPKLDRTPPHMHIRPEGPN